jgi:hypothetical protein
VCPVKGIIGDYKKPEEKAAAQPEAAKAGKPKAASAKARPKKKKR